MGSVDLLQVALGPCAHGCFTTRGVGAPPVTPAEPYAGLNLAAHVGDDPETVARTARTSEEHTSELQSQPKRSDGLFSL